MPIDRNVILASATLFDSSLLLVGGDRGMVRLYNTETGKCVNTIHHDSSGKLYGGVCDLFIDLIIQASPWYSWWPLMPQMSLLV